jgi:hypothetical protein
MRKREAAVFVGLQTSADTVFLFKEYEKTGIETTMIHSKQLGQYIELESSLLKSVVRSGNIGRFWAKPTALVLFPYEQVNELPKDMELLGCQQETVVWA